MAKPIIERLRSEPYKQPYSFERLPLVDHESGTNNLSIPNQPRLTNYKGILLGRTLQVGNDNIPYVSVYDFPEEPLNFSFSLDKDMDFIVAYTMLEHDNKNVYIWYNDTVTPIVGVRDPYLAYCGNDVYFGYITDGSNMLEVKRLNDGFTEVIYSKELTEKHSLVKFGLTEHRRIQYQTKLYN